MAESNPLKILIVDDDPALRRIYTHYLSAEGYGVVEASNGEQALLEFCEENFDIILLDIRMPVTSGNVLAPALKHFHPHAKIVVFSCYTADVQREMIGCADDYFDKSDGCAALLSKIKKITSARHAPEGN